MIDYPVVFVDTETTSLREDRKAWDVALIRRDPDGSETTVQRFVDIDDIDLQNADKFSLEVGQFWQRHPDARHMTTGAFDHEETEIAYNVARMVARATHGATLVGTNVAFDAATLTTLLRDNCLIPSWHYHPCDVKALALGKLHAEHDVHARTSTEELSRLLGVDPPVEGEKHTALGDARWVQRMYDAIMAEEVN